MPATTSDPLRTRSWGLSRVEWLTTAVAAAVSTTGYLVGGADYLARGVVGDLVGFLLLGAVGTALRARVRHEALLCLVLIGVVLLASPDWPLRASSTTWWVAFAAGLLAYLAVRRRLAPR